MSRESDAVRDLAHAPLAYVEKALGKGREAVEQLERELAALENENARLRGLADAAEELVELADRSLQLDMVDYNEEAARVVERLRTRLRASPPQDRPPNRLAGSAGGGGGEMMIASENERIDRAIDLALRYGQIDGDHHKTWVIDQMLRALAGSERRYEKLIADSDPDGEYGPWDAGIAP